MSEPANPPGLDKPTSTERDDLRANRLPDLLYLQSQIGKAIRRLTRPINRATASDADIASASALQRLHDSAVRQCADELQRALDMHGGQ
jgi:hypothetical protein